jgi:hypothetical protein
VTAEKKLIKSMVESEDGKSCHSDQHLAEILIGPANISAKASRNIVGTMVAQHRESVLPFDGSD